MAQALYFPFSRCLDETALQQAVLLYDELSRCGAHRRIRALTPARCALGAGGENGRRLR